MVNVIKDWPVQDRPREKLLQQGPESLSDSELLAIFLRTGIPGKNAVDLARDILKKTGGLQALLKMPSSILCTYPGLGKAKCAQIQACLELGRRYWYQAIRSEPLCHQPEALHRYLMACLGDHSREVFACLLLDVHDRMLRFDHLSAGTLQEAAVYPREIVKHVLLHNAAGVILVHNHPSGQVEPSQADQQLTQHLVRLLSEVGVKVVDHVIVGHGRSFSFCAHGLL